MKHNAARLGCLTSLLLVMLLLAPLGSSMQQENTDFQPRHEGVDFPVGWTEFNLNGPFSPQVRMVYPAMFDGEDKDMAGNGPFPWAVLIGDSGEAIDGYMMLVEVLVQRGYIVVVSQPMSDETDIENTLEFLDTVMGHMVYQNQTNGYVTGSATNIDVEHWALLGHGKGATAAYLAFPFWELTNQAEEHQPPRGLVGYGMDLENLDEDFAWSDVTATPYFASPNTGLFMTGTVDEVSPSQETMERIEAIDGMAWHWMHLLGADHYQFQDTRSIFENDGDPTMSQSAQIEIATEHTVAYLDTVIRGDHARYRDAFNRAEGPRTVSDGSAYIDESLEAARFLVFHDVVVNHDGLTTLNASDTLTIHANWTLRNGDGFQDLPAGWDVNVSCGWEGGAWPYQAEVDTNGTVSCQFPMAPVAPGSQKAWLRLEVEGAPAHLGAQAVRGNTPLEVLYPQPTVYVPQHGEATLSVEEVAVDPDGQTVRVVEATLVGVDASHFGVDVLQEGQELRVHHALEEEWLGECMLELQLRSDGGVVDEVNTSLRVMLTPVDDQVVKDGTVPIQEMNEDGQPVVFDLGTIVSDPEGEDLQIRIDGGVVGEQGPVRFVIDGDFITLTPLENRYGATVLRSTVSDGFNPPIELEIPVVVNAVNDPVTVNLSAWTGDVIMDEDTTYALDLTTLAYDVDEDPLVWTVEGMPAVLTAVVENDSLLITPARDVNGVFSGLWLNVSDGSASHSFSFNVDVRPVGDLPVVGILSIERNDGSATATMQWTVLDVDGEANTDAQILLDGVEVNSNHSCLESTPGAYQCVTLIPLGQTSNTSLYVQLVIEDVELDRNVIADEVFDPSQGGQSGQPSSETDDAGGTAAVLIQTILVVVILVGLVLAGLLLWSNKRAAHATEVFTGPSTEEEPQPSSGGLLARAERLK